MPANSPPKVKVVIGATYWTLNGVNIFSVNLARELLKRGFDTHILLTEEHSDLVQVNDARMERPPDIPFVELPVKFRQNWGAHWGAMIAHLERQSPCIYIPNSDWRHSSICGLLSDRVYCVGVVHSDDPLHYDHVARLGQYWNGIVATSPLIADKVIGNDPSFAPRTRAIPIGVEIPRSFPARPPNEGKPLRVIYHGVLKQHQKRVLDLPKIMTGVSERGVQVQLTIVGGGPDEMPLREASTELIRRGLITFQGVQPHSRIPALLEQHDVFLLPSEFEGMPNALLEAMGRGCIPVVSDIQSAVPDLIHNGDNGFVVPLGRIDAFVDTLEFLQKHPQRRLKLAESAHAKVSLGHYRIEDMVQSYVELFHRIVEDAKSGSFQRPSGELNHPPASVEGVRLFPLDFHFVKPGIGRFPTRCEYAEFKNQVHKIPNQDRATWRSRLESSHSDLRRIQVIISAPSWDSSGVNTFSANLARGLHALGMSAVILLTEEDTVLVNVGKERTSFPEDVSFIRLPVSRETSWGGHWGATVRFLEERAPCIFIPNHDWRHSCVTPLLSARIAVVGIIHEDHPLHLNHVQRLGRYWNAVIAISEPVAGKVRALDPSLAERIAVISNESDQLGKDYQGIFEELFDASHQCVYKRPRGVLNHPPPEVAGISVFPVELRFEDEIFGRFPNEHKDFREFQAYRQMPEKRQDDNSDTPPSAEVISPALTNESVFSRWDFTAFLVLTSLLVASLIAFLNHWFRLNAWSAHPGLFAVWSTLMIIAIINQLGRWFLLPLMKRPPMVAAPPHLKTAVITTFAPRVEALEMLKNTVIALVNIEYPHDTWVLDEDDDTRVKEVCQELGARHFSRKALTHYQEPEGRFKSHSKHGNVNAWLFAIGFDRYDFITSFDPDHIPQKNFLHKVLGFFTDPRVGYVQAPQAYYNQQASFVARGGAEETYDYYSCVQMAAYGAGYPIIVGCHNTHRTSALRQVGGFAPHDADDLMLTSLYRNHDWKGVYIPEILARGLTPVDWASYLRQQRRWARSVIDLKLWHYPRLSANLSPASKVMNLLHGLNYFHKSVTIAVALLLLLHMLSSGIHLEGLFSGLATPFVALLGALQLGEWYRQKFFLDRFSERGIAWRAWFLQFAKWPVMLLAIFDGVTKRRFPYQVTNKSASPQSASLLFLPNILLIALICLACLAGYLSGKIAATWVYVCALFVIIGANALIWTEFRGFPPPYDASLMEHIPHADPLVTAPPRLRD
jgi:cellulose synthase/poly-beta-1,6-N-acetylglucosamine synthase-like glycosyltransferase/glycosyltransferase involved in cell wall biosynthesis